MVKKKMRRSVEIFEVENNLTALYRAYLTANSLGSVQAQEEKTAILTCCVYWLFMNSSIPVQNCRAQNFSCFLAITAQHLLYSYVIVSDE